MRQVIILGGKYKRRDILESGHRRIALVGNRVGEFRSMLRGSVPPLRRQNQVPEGY